MALEHHLFVGYTVTFNRYERRDMPKAKDAARCHICGKVCQGVSAVKAHIRAAHLKKAEDADFERIPFSQLTQAAPPASQTQGQVAAGVQSVPVAFDAASFQQALTNAMAPVMQGLRGVQTAVAKPAPRQPAETIPVVPTPGTPATPPVTTGLTEATATKLCTGIECFRKSAEVLAEAVKDGTFIKFPQPAVAGVTPPATTETPAKGEADGTADPGSDHEHVGHLHSQDDATKAMRQMMACPDGICQRAVRREVLANWPALFGEKLSIQMAQEDGTSENYFKAFTAAFATNDGTDVMPVTRGEGSGQNGQQEGQKANAQQGAGQNQSQGEGQAQGQGKAKGKEGQQTKAQGQAGEEGKAKDKEGQQQAQGQQIQAQGQKADAGREAEGAQTTGAGANAQGQQQAAQGEEASPRRKAGSLFRGI